MNNKPHIKNNKGSSGYVFVPVFAAIALIITCAFYIVYKLAKQEVSERWSDYDECGWS